jgi:hypothetical protein
MEENYIDDDILSPELNKPPKKEDFNFDDVGDAPIEEDNSRWEMDPDDVFNIVERSLRGQQISMDGTRYVKTAKPLCNNFGVATIMRELRALVNKNVILSNLRSQEINNRMRAIMKSFVNLLKSSYKEFGVESKWQLNEIVQIFESNVFCTFKRAEGGIERKIRRDKYRLTENMNNNSGGFSFPNFFGTPNKPKEPKNYSEVNL